MQIGLHTLLGVRFFQGEAAGSQEKVDLTRAVARLGSDKLCAAGEGSGGSVAGMRNAGRFLLCG